METLFKYIFMLLLGHINFTLGYHGRLRCDQFASLDYNETCGFSLEP
jgi:hypothetical protein